MSYSKIPGSYTPDGQERIPLNCIWLNTIYWSFNWNFVDSAIGYSFESELFSVYELDCQFYFKMHKKTNESFLVEIYRVLKDPNERPDNGFILHLIFSVVGLKKQPRDYYMKSSSDVESVSCDVSTFNPEILRNCCWIVKCGFEMCEMTTLDNEDFREQNKLLKDIQKRKKRMASKLSVVAFLVNCSRFDSVFSGRQTYEFAKKKAELIEKTVEFADEILGNFINQAGASFNPFPRRTGLGEILGYIYVKKRRCITDDEILVLYFMSFRYGLRYLKRECVEYMKDNLQDSNFVLDVLIFCNVLCDNSSLMYEAMVELLRRMREIGSSEKWETLTNTHCPILRSVLESLICEIMEMEPSPIQQRAELFSDLPVDLMREMTLNLSQSVDNMVTLKAKKREEKKNMKLSRRKGKSEKRGRKK